MANIVRRYMFVGPSNSDLLRYVAGSASLAATFSGPIVDINIDNALGDIASLDAFMLKRGFIFSSAAVPLSTAIIPYAPLASVAANVTIFVTDGGTSVVEDLACWSSPRACQLNELTVNVPTNTLTGSTTFTIRVSPAANNPFAPTTLTVAVGAGTTGVFSINSPVAIGIGDRVSLGVVTGGLAGTVSFSAGLEVL